MSYPVKTILTLLLLLITGCAMPLPALPPTGTPVTVPVGGNCPETGPTASLVRNDATGYCFHIPAGYEAESFAEAGSLVVRAPTTSPGHRERLIISVEDALGRTLEQVTEQLLLDNSIPGFDFEVSEAFTVGGEAATVIGRMPGQDLNRRVLVVHGGRVYRMMFMPDDAEAGQPYEEMEDLFATLMESFTFIPPTAPLGIPFPNAEDAGYPAQATLAWERRVYGDSGAMTQCQRLAITDGGATWAGSCDQAEMMTESGAYQWAEIVQRFAPFVYRSGEWDLTFAGQGEIYHPAWQHALVHWAQATYSETLDGRVSATGRTALSWWLGAAEGEEGLCKHLVVLSHGYAYANLTRCEGGEAHLVAEGWLETPEMAAFDGWLSTAAPTYVDENYLDGGGEQELDEGTLTEIAAWADHVYTVLVEQNR